MSERASRPLPPLLLERLAAGELDEEQEAEVRRRLAESPAGEQHMETLRASNDAILRQYPPRTVAAAIRERDERRRASRRRLWLGAPLGAAVMTLVAVILLPQWHGSGGREPSLYPGPNRAKGPPVLTVFRKGERGEEQLASGAVVRSGDLLQMAYNGSGARYGVIFSVDGRGTVTLHYPDRVGESTALAGAGVQILPFSYELDDAPQFECFVFVASDRPLDTGQLLDRARGLSADPRQPLELQQRADVARVLLKKASVGGARP